MRQKDRKFKPHEKGLFVAGLAVAAFLAVMLYVPQIVMGGTDTTNKSIGAAWADTCFYVVRDLDDNSLIDSSWFDETFPYDTLYTYDNTKNYSTKEGWYFPGEGWAIWTDFIIYTFATSPTPSYLVSWYVIDSTSDVVVPGAKATSKNWALDATLADPTADANGIAVTSVDSDSIATIVTATGYIFPTTYDSIFFTTDTSDTIYGYPTASGITAPTGDSTATVYGYLFDDASASDHGLRSLEGKKVTFTIANDVYNICLERALHDNTVTTTIDAAGYFSVELTYSSCLALLGSTTSDTVSYDMQIEGWTNTRKVTVPNSSTYQVTWQ